MGTILTVGSKFKPYSFDELIRPYAMYTQEYNDIENLIGELSLKASVWDNMINKDIDKKAYDMQTAYKNELSLQVDNIIKNGVNPESRLKLLNLKKRYGSEITPIEQAYTKRLEMLKQYNLLRALNPTLISTIDPTKLSLDALIENPSLTPEYDSLARITQASAEQAKNLAKDKVSKGAWKTTANGLMIEQELHRGFTKEEIQNAINGKGSSELETIINNSINSSPASKWSNFELLKPMLRLAALQGLYEGVGGTDFKQERNADYRNYSLQLDDRIKEYQLNSVNSQTAKSQSSNSVELNDLDQEDIISSRNVNKIDKTFVDLNTNSLTTEGWNLVKNYIEGKYKDSNIKYTKEPSRAQMEQDARDRINKLNSRKNAESILKSLNIDINDISARGGISKGTLNERLSKILNNESYDGIKTRTDRFFITDDASKGLSRKLGSLPKDTKLYAVTDIDNKGQYTTDSGTKISELFDKDEDMPKISKINYNSVNNTFTFNKDGENYILPKSLFSPAQLRYITENSMKLHNDELIDQDINSDPTLSKYPERKEEFRKALRNNIIKANNYHIQSIFSAYKEKPE